MSRYKKLSADWTRENIILFAKPDMLSVFKDYFKIFGGGTRLAMPKTTCASDSSSLKPGSGATEGVLD